MEKTVSETQTKALENRKPRLTPTLFPRLLTFSERDGGGYGIDPANGEIFSWNHDGGLVTTVSSDLIAFLKNIIERMMQLQKN